MCNEESAAHRDEATDKWVPLEFPSALWSILVSLSSLFWFYSPQRHCCDSLPAHHLPNTNKKTDKISHYLVEHLAFYDPDIFIWVGGHKNKLYVLFTVSYGCVYSFFEFEYWKNTNLQNFTCRELNEKLQWSPVNKEWECQSTRAAVLLLW